MAEPPVVNASPLIFLAGADQLELLRLSSGRVLVPLAVAEEIRQYGATDPAALAIEQTDWLDVIDPGPVPPDILKWNLGDGEASVLTWALVHPGSEAIVDDRAARRAAEVLGIPVRGTVGLVLTAKQRGELSAARPVLEELRQSGMYLSDEVLNAALALVGE